MTATIQALAEALKIWCGDALCPKTGCGCCNTCGFAGDERCARCGCGCRPDGTPKSDADYCKNGCKTEHGDLAVLAAEDEADADEGEAGNRGAELEDLGRAACGRREGPGTPA